MQIVTDGAMDAAPEQLAGLDNLHVVPFQFTFSGTTYTSGVDITAADFYSLLASAPDLYPTTSLPAPGTFVEVYRRVAALEPDILHLSVSSGLSGTYNSAQLAAGMVKEAANVTLYDTRTLSAAQAWHVVAAAQAARLGWSLDRILALLARITAQTETLFTVATLKYLLHGGRISHLKGLLGSILNIKPVIAVDKIEGRYQQAAMARTLNKALGAMVDQIETRFKPGTALRLQVMHAANPEGAAFVRERLERTYDATWLPTGEIAPVLGAHTGAGLVGVVFAPADVFSELPAPA